MKNPYDETEHPVERVAFAAGEKIGWKHREWNEQRRAQLAKARAEVDKKRAAKQKYQEATAPDRVGAWQKGYQSALREGVET